MKLRPTLGLKQTGHDANAAHIFPSRASGYAPGGAKTGKGSLYSTTGTGSDFFEATHKERSLNRVPWPGFGWGSRGTILGGSFASRMVGPCCSQWSQPPESGHRPEYYADKEAAVIVFSNSHCPVLNPQSRKISPPWAWPNRSAPKPMVPVPGQRGGMGDTWKGGTVCNFYRPNAKLAFRSRNDERLLGWGNTFKATLVPVANKEFMERQFWARLKTNSDGTLFSYSVPGRDFQVKPISSK
jgi:hypothetical protein